jgi:hypothetical protein
MSDERPELTPTAANELVRAAELHAQGQLNDDQFDELQRRILGDEALDDSSGPA